jgi:hypothetical protein
MNTTTSAPTYTVSIQHTDGTIYSTSKYATKELAEASATKSRAAWAHKPSVRVIVK